MNPGKIKNDSKWNIHTRVKRQNDLWKTRIGAVLRFLFMHKGKPKDNKEYPHSALLEKVCDLKIPHQPIYCSNLKAAEGIPSL